MQKIYVQMIPCWQKRFEQGDRVWIANIDDVQNEMPFEYELLQMRGVHTAIVVPVMSQNHLNGFMGLDNPGTEFGQLAAKLLQDAGTHISYIREYHRTMQKERGQMKLWHRHLRRHRRRMLRNRSFYPVCRIISVCL